MGMIYIMKHKSAFTLAEVLIVLGIIGIVAQMTIPTLVQSSQEQSWKVGAKAAYSKSYQAINLMKNDQGGTLSGYFAARTFYSEFIKYFKILEKSDPNVPTDPHLVNFYWDLTKTNYTSLPDGGNFLLDDGQFTTADGMLYAIDNTGISKTRLTVDVNGYRKKPNTLGKDVFIFEINNDNLMPMGADGTSYPAATYCDKNTPSVLQGAGCMQYIMLDKTYY